MHNIDSLLLKMNSEADSRDMLIPISMDDKDGFVYRRLEDVHHLLIGGTTGSGKTSFIMSMLATLVSRHSIIWRMKYDVSAF